MRRSTKPRSDISVVRPPILLKKHTDPKPDCDVQASLEWKSWAGSKLRDQQVQRFTGQDLSGKHGALQVAQCTTKCLQQNNWFFVYAEQLLGKTKTRFLIVDQKVSRSESACWSPKQKLFLARDVSSLMEGTEAKAPSCFLRSLLALVQTSSPDQPRETNFFSQKENW